MRPAFAPTRAVPQRRLGATPSSTAARARRGGPAGTPRSGRAYRACLLTWVAGEPTHALIEQMRHAALHRDRTSLLVSLDRTRQVLLLAEDSLDGPSRASVDEAVHSVVDAVRAVQPEARIHAVVGNRLAPGERIGITAARLRQLARRALAGSADDPVRGRRHSLGSLLETLDARQAATFVDAQLAGLRAYDREHGTNLQGVLELALDHQDRNAAASAAFMHRNTFRRQLGKALELVGADLADPEERLALHVALKLRGSRAVPSGPRR